MIKPPQIVTSQTFSFVESMSGDVKKVIGITFDDLWKGSVDVASVSDIILSGPQVIDDYYADIGNLVLVTEQTNPVENGIYVVNEFDWERADILISNGTTVFILNGTNFAFKLFTCISNGTIGINPTYFQLVYATQSSASGSNGYIQFNNGGLFDSSPNLTYDPFTETLTCPKLISTRISIPNNPFGAKSLDLPSSGVTPGDYTNPTIVINNNGIILNATSGSTPTAPGLNTGVLYNVGNDFDTDPTFTYVSPLLTVPRMTCNNFTCTGSITLSPTGVTPGLYLNANVTVNSNGRITNITSGAKPSPTGTNFGAQYNNSGTFSSSADVIIDSGPQVRLKTLKYGLLGTSALVNGSVTISIDNITNYNVMISRTSTSTDLGYLVVDNKTPTSFRVRSYTSLNVLVATDNSSFDYCVILI